MAGQDAPTGEREPASRKPGGGDLLAAGFSFLVLDFDADLILVSAAGAPRHGLHREVPVFPGAGLADVLGVQRTRDMEQLINGALSGEPGAVQVDASDGREGRTFRITFLPRMVDGSSSGLVLTVHDITARQTGLARLLALEDRHRAILAHAADAILVIGVDGRIEEVNAAAERLSGWGEGDLVGQPVEQLMGEAYAQAHQGQIDRYLTEGVSGILNVGPRPLPLRRKGGATTPIELSVGEAVIAGERKFIGVCRDITSRLAQDEALRAANEALRSKIAELETLAAVAQGAREAAEAANRTKSQFVATMSHELRTPLNGILAVADALGRRELPTEDLELVRIIQSSGQGLLSILNEVLDLAKVEAGGLLLDPRPFSPAETLAAVVDVWRFAADAKGVALRLEAPGLPDGLLGDAHRVRQILSNLVNNAIKFTDRGEVVLVARWSARRSMMRFEVTDSGPGIPEHQRERLFDPFVQAEAGTTRKHGGTGLGLTICRELAVLMRGRIWAEAAPGGGARMVCELPFELASSPAGETPGQGEGERADLPDILILVAEDHPLNRRVASIVLDHAGLRHEFVEDGAAAVEAVRSGRFDMVLMDVHMPRMDGLAATRAIRELPAPAGAIPIIAVTANAAPDEVAECRDAGMDDYVAKPISAASLLQRIAEHVGQPARPDRA